MSLPHLNNTNYQSFIADNEIAIVDYFADWCGPCQMMGPIFEEVGAQTVASGKKAVFAKINIDEANEAATEAGVMSIPTIIVYKNGEEVDRHIGGAAAEQLTTFINNNLD